MRILRRMVVQLLCGTLALTACARREPDPRKERERLFKRDLASFLEQEQKAWERCAEFRRRPSTCHQDSDCTSVTGLGCWELVISKDRLPEAQALKGTCRQPCPDIMELGPNSSIPICEKQVCVWRESSRVDPMDTCLDRHLERFPDDRTPIVIEIRPQPTGPSVVASGDEREVARCLEDRLLHTLVARPQAATVTFTPGVPFMAEVPNSLVVVPPVYHQTKNTGIVTEPVHPPNVPAE